MSEKTFDIITKEVEQSRDSSCSKPEFTSPATVKKLFCNELELHNYIEPNYFTIHLPWDNTEFIKIILRQMCKRIGVTSLTYTNSSTEHTNILQIKDSKQQQQKIKSSRTDNLKNYYKIKYFNLLRNLRKNADHIKQKASREILDKLSASHEEHLKSQEDTYEEIINKITSSHEAKIKSISKFYEDQLKEAHKNENNLRILSDQLRQQNDKLTNTINMYEYKLNNIENLLLGRPPTSEKHINNTSIFDIKPEGAPKNTNLEEREKEISELKAKLERMKKIEAQKETQFTNELKTKEEVYKNLLMKKESHIEQLLAQIKYKQDVLTEHEKRRKEKDTEICELQKQLECCELRHNEQFKHYEKLVVKGRNEIEVHKREINRLQEHISSVNFTGSPAIRPKQILESTSSSKKTPRQTPKRTPLTWCEEDCAKQDSQKVKFQIASNEIVSVTTKSVAQCLNDKFQHIKIKDAAEDNKYGVSLSLTDSGASSYPSTQQESVKSTEESTKSSKGSQQSGRKRGRPRKNPNAK